MENDKIRIFEGFSGYGTSSFALKQLGIEYECVGFSEIDKYAIQCFEQNHCFYDGIDSRSRFPKNYGDISKIDWNSVPDFDLLTGGFPCTDVSVAGKQDLTKGRTILGMELTKSLNIKQPKYFLFENVKGLMSKKFDKFRNGLIKSWEDCGYKVYSQILNTKDYGIPQSRARVFFVGIRKDINQDFKFPEKEELKIFIKDILEENVDEKYYLSPLLQERFKKYLEGKETKICRMVGRNPENPKSRISGLPTEQVIEKKEDGTSNTLSTFQKDNLVYDDYNHRFTNKDYIGSVRQTFGNQALNNGVKIYDRKGFDSRTKGFRESDLSPTLSQKMGTGGNNVPMVLGYINKSGEHQSEVVVDKEGIAPTLSAVDLKSPIKRVSQIIDAIEKSGDLEQPKILDLYNRTANNKIAQTLSDPCHNSMRLLNQGQLRRLTPTECFRLQGFLNDEVNLDGISDTQRYKLAGNGQTVTVVEKIFKQMFMVEE